MIRLALMLFMLTLRAGAAEEVVAGLSQRNIAITADFSGSDILVYGAVKRETPIATDTALQVIITLEGPTTPVLVRRKSRQFGIWINTEAVEIDEAPSFYAIATTRPLAEILSHTEDLRHSVSVPRAIRSVGAPVGISDPQSFTDALIRIRSNTQIYGLEEGQVGLRQETLFSARFDLPANLTEGRYKARIFLTRDRKVVDSYQAVIAVRKEGLERILFNMAHEQPLAYGLLSLFLAVLAGWGASAMFRLIRN